jgi:predicted ATPase
MRLLAATGERGAAMAQFETSRQAMEEELGIEPEEETVALYERIRDGTRPFTASTPIHHNLPTQATSLIGRQDERTMLRSHLNDPEVQLVTIAGPGGIGKTHLATVVAHKMVATGQFTDGVLFVPLESVTTRKGMTTAITAAMVELLHTFSAGSRATETMLIEQLRDRNVLILLDNFEQLSAEARFLEQLLSAALQVKLLVTSRERLKLSSEWVLELDGLSYPEHEHDTAANSYDAVRLFDRRARQARASFSLADNLAAVVHICRLTLGVPLALELAASWIPVLPAHEIAGQIEQGIDFLSTTLRDLPSRHRSMRAVFDSTWQLLSGDEQRAISKLSVFRGGFTRQAAEEAVGASLPLLSRLVDKSMLSRGASRDERARFHLHELIRQYAYERLLENGEAATKQAHSTHFRVVLNLAEKAEKHWDTLHETAWLGRLEMERDNIRAALSWALDRQQAEPALRLNAALFTLWTYISPATEFDDWLEASLALPWDDSSATTIGARAKALNVAGYGAVYSSAFERAVNRFKEGLDLYSRLDDQRGMAWSLRGCGFVAMIQGEAARARPYVEQSLAICLEVQDEWGHAWSISDLGEIALTAGNAAQAQSSLEEALARFRQLGVLFGVFRGLICLGHALRRQEQWELARARYLEALALQQQVRFTNPVANALEGLAMIALETGKAGHAVQLFAAAQSRRDSIEMTRYAYMDRDCRRALLSSQKQLSDDVWRAAWAEGYDMTPEQAVALALASEHRSNVMRSRTAS